MCRPLVPVALLLVLTLACANPPEKEMNQAQGAIAAARAAGAEEYAPAELAAAVSSLDQAQGAVDQRDYRLALSHALDASERAQAAARRAADHKAIVRSDVERSVHDLGVAVGEIETRLKPLRNLRTTAKTVAAADRTLGRVNKAVQEARTALANEKYLQAQEALKGQAERIKALSDDLDALDRARRRR